MAAVKQLPTVEIDIKTRIIDADEPIYVLFPGERYTLFNLIEQRSVLVLDFPGLDLAGARSARDLPDLVARVAMSTRIRNWYASGASDATKPSRDPKDYQRFSLTEKRSLYVGAVEAVFFDLKPGTIVVVPGPGHWGRVLIGEVTGGRASVAAPTIYPGEQLPARRVRWLAKLPKSYFSQELIERLPTPNPFTLLTKQFHEEALTAAFDNVIYGNRFISKFSTTQHAFNALDSYRIQFFINFISGAFIASENTDNDKKVIVDFESALEFLVKNPDLVPELTLDIKSPGFLTMLSEGIAPIIVASFLALALAGCDDIKASQIKMINSVGPTHDCDVSIGAGVRDTFTFIGFDDWKKLCDSARAAHHDTGFKTSIVVPGR